MKNQATQSIQDYLKWIYELTREGSPASTNQLAHLLKVKPASVTGMIQRLASEKQPLLEYQKHQGVTLTNAGRRVALEVIRRHRLLETWLVQSLGYPWDKVHEEAERLEHVISQEFEQRIAAALGHPARDPHGELIPTEDLLMPDDTSTVLLSLRPPLTVKIQRVNAQDPRLLRHLESLGLTPGTWLELLDYSPFDDNLTIRSNGRVIVLGNSITAKIFVQFD